MSGTTVLGKWPGYITLAHRLGARHFDVGSVAWRAMGPRTAWIANAHFLDSVHRAGDTFVFSIDPTLVRTGTLLKELQYLRQKNLRIRRIAVGTV